MSLGKLTVNTREDGFLCDGKPFFWFADTCWSAFTSIIEDDWDYYLTRRAEQGMNVLQINTLPQWDRCLPDLGIWPYASEDGVHFDWSAPNQEYWDRARRMCQAAVEHGIRPALVLMWCNYVPGTWGSVIAERLGAEVMPREEVRAHVARVVENLGEFDPVYVVAGDTDFKTDEAIAYYGDALDEVTKLASSPCTPCISTVATAPCPSSLPIAWTSTCSSPATTIAVRRKLEAARGFSRAVSQKADGQFRALLRANGREPQRVLAFYRAGLSRECLVEHSGRCRCRHYLRCARRVELADLSEPWQRPWRGL